jgi:hypothetical protein
VVLSDETIRDLIWHLEADLAEAEERLKAASWSKEGGNGERLAAERDRLKRHLAELRRL